MAAHVLSEDGHDAKVYDVTGPAAVTYADVAAALSAVIGKPVDASRLPDHVTQAFLAIEDRGLRRFSDEEGIGLEDTFRTLLTGLAVRYYKSVAG